MRRKIALVEFTIRDENTPCAYIDWAELKQILHKDDYSELLIFLSKTKLECKKAGIPVKVFRKFLEYQSEIEKAEELANSKPVNEYYDEE